MKHFIYNILTAFVLLTSAKLAADNFLENSSIGYQKNCKVKFSDDKHTTINCKGLSESHKGTKYIIFDINFHKTIDLKNKEINFEVKTSTPKEIAAFYVRLFNENQKKPCWSFLRWNHPFFREYPVITISPSGSNYMKWEQKVVNKSKANKVKKIRFYIATLQNNTPINIELSNFSVCKAKRTDIWTKIPQRAKKPANVTHPCGYIKAEDIRTARENYKSYVWAKELVEKFEDNAEFWMQLPDDQIKDWIPADEAFSKCLCPNCFTQPEFAWAKGIQKDGKSIKCSKCKTVFPNKKFPEDHSYKVVSPHGKVRTIKFYKGPDQMTHKENMGSKYHITGALNSVKLRRLVSINALTFLYVIKGEKKYAEKIRKILLRFAEVYPDYSPKFRAKIYASPKDNFMAGKLSAWKYKDSVYIILLATAYDLTYNSGLYSNEDKLTIENGIFREYKWLITAFPPNKEWCQNAVPAHMTATALCAAQLGDHELTKWLLDSRGGLVDFVKKNYTRDGFYFELTPSYSGMANTPLLKLIDTLQGYSDSADYKGKNPYKNLDIFKKIPKIKRVFSAYNKLYMPNGKLPPVNDSSYTSGLSLQWLEFNNNNYPTPLNSFLLTQKRKSSNQWGYMYSLFKGKKIRTKPSASALKSSVFAGAEWALLRNSPNAIENAMLLVYNSYCPHWHHATLNYLYYDYGQELVTDLGYLSWQHPFLYWLKSPMAHTSVIVNGKRQGRCKESQLDFWAGKGGIQAVSASAPESYRGITQIYKRTIFTIKLPGQRQYLADFFTVSGGKTHLFCFHADGEEFITTSPDKYKKFDSKKLGEKYTGRYWLKNTRSQVIKQNSIFTWKNKKDITTKLFWPVNKEETIILADGPGARNLRNPYDKTRINIVMSSRQGPQNVFANVVEASKGNGLISKVSLLKHNGGKLCQALEVIHQGGTDIIISANSPQKVSLVKYPELDLNGQYAVIRLRKSGKLKELWLGNGSKLKWNEKVIQNAENMTGTILNVDKANKKLITDLPPVLNYDLCNNYLILPKIKSGTYKIHRLSTENGKVVIYLDKNEIINIENNSKFFIAIHKKEKFDGIK